MNTPGQLLPGTLQQCRYCTSRINLTEDYLPKPGNTGLEKVLVCTTHEQDFITEHLKLIRANKAQQGAINQ